MRRAFTFILEVEVYDEAALKEASRLRAIADGIDEEDWRESQADGPAYNLQMLLDPGLMLDAGTDILHSYVREVT